MSDKNPTGADEARELFEQRHSPDEWSDEEEPAVVRPSRDAVLSIRISRDELDALEKAAAAKGENLSEYVRRAVTNRILGSISGFRTVLNRSTGYVETQNQSDERSVWNEPPRYTLEPEPNHSLQSARTK